MVTLLSVGHLSSVEDSRSSTESSPSKRSLSRSIMETNNRQLNTDMRSQNYDEIRFASYRTACKLRFIQKKTNLYLVDLWNVIESIREQSLTSLDQVAEIPSSRVESLLSVIFYQLNKRLPSNSQIDAEHSARTLHSWLLATYDTEKKGVVSVFCLKVALSTLCSGKLMDKLRYIFTQISNSHGTLVQSRFHDYLTGLLALPTAVYEGPSFGYNDTAARGCFDSDCNKVTLNHFLDTLMADPGPQCLLWLPILHRMATVENVLHPVQCECCKSQSFIGFRYKCQRCHNYHMCQDCFWRGKTSSNHSNDHQVKEYSSYKSPAKEIGQNLKKTMRCVPQKPGNNHIPKFPETPEKTINLSHIVPATPPPVHNGFRNGSYNSLDRSSVDSTGSYKSLSPPVVGGSSTLPTQSNHNPQKMKKRSKSVDYNPELDEEHSSIAFHSTKLLSHSTSVETHNGGGHLLSHCTDEELPNGRGHLLSHCSGEELPNGRGHLLSHCTGEELPNGGGHLLSHCTGEELPNGRGHLLSHCTGEELPNGREPPLSHCRSRDTTNSEEHLLIALEAARLCNEVAALLNGNVRTVSVSSDDSLKSPSKMTTLDKEAMRVDDEHRLIARYAARLAVDANNAVSDLDLSSCQQLIPPMATAAGAETNGATSNHQQDTARSPTEMNGGGGGGLDANRMQRELIAQLEFKNREILKEIQRLRIEQEKQAKLTPKDGSHQGNPSLIAELRLLRQRKDELEARMAALQESRRELMVQLETLMKLLKNSPRSTPNSSPRSRSTQSPPMAVPRGNSLPNDTTQRTDLLSGVSGDIRQAFQPSAASAASMAASAAGPAAGAAVAGGSCGGASSSMRSLRNDLLVAADSVTNAMSSLVKELNSASSDSDGEDDRYGNNPGAHHHGNLHNHRGNHQFVNQVNHHQQNNQNLLGNHYNANHQVAIDYGPWQRALQQRLHHQGDFLESSSKRPSERGSDTDHDVYMATDVESYVRTDDDSFVATDDGESKTDDEILKTDDDDPELYDRNPAELQAVGHHSKYTTDEESCLETDQESYIRTDDEEGGNTEWEESMKRWVNR